MELLQLQQLRHEDIQQTEHISIQLQNLTFAKDCLNVALSYMKCKTKLGRNNMELQQLQRKKIKYCLNVALSYECKTKLGRNNTELQQLQRTTPPKPTPAV